MKKVTFIIPREGECICDAVKSEELRVESGVRCLESIKRVGLPQAEYEVIEVDGHEAALNAGLDAAQGEYVWFVEAGDSIKPEMLSGFLQKAAEQNLDILLFNRVEVREDGSENRRFMYMRHDDVVTGVAFTNTYCAPHNLPIVADYNCCLYKRTFLEANKIRFSEVCGHADVVFAWKAILLAQRVSSEIELGYERRVEGGKWNVDSQEERLWSLVESGWTREEREAYAKELEGLMQLTEQPLMRLNLEKEREKAMDW